MKFRKFRYILCSIFILNIIVLYYFWKLQTHFNDPSRSSPDDSIAPRHHIQSPSSINVRPRRTSRTRNEYRHRPNYGPLDELTSGMVNFNSNTIAKLVTVIFREYEFFENDIREDVESFFKVLPDVRIIILADAYPYPPLEFPTRRPHDSPQQMSSLSASSGNSFDVRLIVLHPHIDEPRNASNPELYVDTPFALLVPDSIRITSVRQIEEMIKSLVTSDLRRASTASTSSALTDPCRLVAAKVAGEKAKCVKYVAKLKEWTLEMKESDIAVDSGPDRETQSGNICDGIQGVVVLLMRTKDLFDLSQPFARPLPYALFIQTVVRHWKVKILKNTVFQQGKPLFLDAHLKWKHSRTGKERLKMLYEDFGIKKVVTWDSSGTIEDIEWHGCNKGTARCFGTVLHDTPDYLLANRWTPPCCLEGLRETARHVFRTLKSCGVRYWLEGGSLLGAARSGDIIPWDYDVDIGIYEEDVAKCGVLKDSINRAVTTSDGFVWERAVEGEFFRVQYSQTNHLHVDIFPFYSSNGIMTKKTWFKTHRQDTEFPEHYLRPLATIHFVGIEASAPNNIREFLELKFGDGVIENPQYPNPKLIAFPNVSVTRF